MLRFTGPCLFCLILLLDVPTRATAQEVPIHPPATQPAPPRNPQAAVSPYLRANPAMLMRLRNDFTIELQQIQRTLAILDPNDIQLSATLKEQQAELLGQLKDVNAQLKAQGIPVVDENTTSGATPPLPPETGTAIPAIPKADDPTLVPGGTRQPPADPNLLIQRQGLPNLPGAIPGAMPGAVPGAMPGQYPNLPPGFNPAAIPGSLPPGSMGVVPGGPIPANPPTDFDQEQIWADSPWTPRPSKELNDLKQTVDALRRELAEMKATVTALETQIRLLNRNILLTQPAAANQNQ